MALTNYTDLKATVASYLGRTDLTNQIPDFISLAELRLSRDLRTRKLLKSVTTTMTGGDPTIGLPSDFLELRDIYIEATPRITVSYMSPSAFSRDARTTDSGRPVFYTALGSELQFAPIPDTNYTVEMLYYFKPVAMSVSVASNEFMANYPDAMLYATLGEAEPYLMNDARINTWAAMYDRAIARINTSDENSEYAGAPISMSVTTR